MSFFPTNLVQRHCPRPSRHLGGSSRQGIALVATLAMVAIVSLLLVAFVTMMQLDRSATQSYSQSVKAEHVAQGSVQLILNELQKEMAKDAPPDLSYPDFPLYTNVTSANLLPQRTGANVSMPNLVKVSTKAAPIFSGTLMSGTCKASEVSSVTPSQNGRFVSTTRWQKISLGAFPDDASAPDWVLLTRGGATDGAASTFGASGNTINNPAPGNLEYAIGRFAYAIYDEGGLLNINVAGYPASAAAASRYKGSVVWADLAQIPGVLDANALVQWRNPASSATSTTYLNYATNSGPASGFAQVVPGNTTFLSRGELIQYARENPTVLTAAALPCLTTFSRDLNAPAWGPNINGTGASFQYKTDANTPTGVNRLFPGVRVSTPFTRTDGTSAKAGDQLVTRRFPLSRLASVSYGATANPGSDIFKYFGLKRSAVTDPWVYCNADGTPATAIKTLRQVADEGREPNFFELLYACILNGSLGKKISGYSFAATDAADSNPYFQALRIGANIIDQYDADNYPTTLSFAVANPSDPATPDMYAFYGIEDLPYPNKLMTKWATDRPVTKTSPTINWWTKFKVEMFFEMWNPHQEMPSSGSAAGPTQFRIIADPAGMYEIGSRTLSSVPTGFKHATPSVGAIPADTIVKFNATPGSYREPYVVRQDSATLAGDASILSFPTSPAGSSRALGFKLNGPAMPYPTPPATHNTLAELNSTGWGYYITLTDMLFSFQYLDTSGQWKTYATFAGMADLPASGVQQTGAVFPNVNNSYPLPSYTRAGTMGSLSYMKSDPRTWRFSISQGNPDTNTTPYQADNPLIASTDKVFKALYGSPFGNLRLDLLAHNQTPPSAIAGYNGYVDADGIKRPGDSFLENPVGWETSATAKPPMKGGVSETRPIILNRPFRSVGELGYVFRDMPWKSLDLFSADSADTGLLDAFCIEDSPAFTSGRVNLNTRNASVLKAVLSGVTTQEPSTTLPAGATMDAATADSVAQAIVTASTATPLVDLGDLASRLATDTTSLPSTNKLVREAVMRSLADSASTRTWNLVVDVVAQVGRYSANATALDQFVVEGERRYWVHVAIDRYTGKIIDQYVETADE
ncbi:MAG: hypothetical protein ACAI35_16035 [Candidatus Methylacidiphilales bacterium]|nr:hypothetical protein [Candidatus Methylacidiphilales bacterium]